MYIHVDMNTIALILYIGILLMAATVAGMTIVYFLKPGASRTSRALIAERKRRAQIETQESGAVEIQPVVASTVNTIETVSSKVSASGVKPASEVNNKVEIKKESPKQEPVNQKEKGVKADLPTQPKAVDKLVPKLEVKKEENKTQTPAVVQNPIGSSVPKSTASTLPITAANAAVPMKTAAKDIKPPAKTEPEKPKTAQETPKPAPSGIKADNEKKGPEPNSLGDLSKMFSKDVAEDTEATKLAKNLKDVDITGLLKDGQDLISFLKKGWSK